MSQPQLLPESQTLLERPACAHCGSQMWLTRIAPDIEDHECRTFECPVCQQTKVKIVKFK